MSADKGDTWPKILKYNDERYGSARRALRHKRLGVWEVYTWRDYYQQVKYLALGLLSLGLCKGDKVLIIGDNTPEWYFSELAVQAAGGVSVGLFPDLSPGELQTLAADCQARFAVVEDQEQVDKILSVAPALPLLEKVIYWNYKGLSHYQDPVLLKFKEILEMGRRKEQEEPGRFEERLEAGKADDVCAIIYTSGSEGPLPKGVVHTFRSLKAGAEMFLALDPWLPEDNLLPLLPPVWITEQWLSVGGHLLSACTLNLAETAETHPRDMKETGPSIVCQSTALWESQASRIQARLEETHALGRLLFRLSLPRGRRRAQRRIRGERPGLKERILCFAADRLLFHPLKKSLGLTHARITYCVGSVVSPEVLRFFQTLGLPLKNVYVSTEAGPLCGLKGASLHDEAIGPLADGKRVLLQENGELLFRGDALFSGYCGWSSGKEPFSPEGWYSSGDCGRLRRDGQVEIVGRLSELMVLKDGTPLAPQAVESRLRLCPFIREVWVSAEPHTSLVFAVLVLHFQELSRWAGRHRLQFSGLADLTEKEEVRRLIGEEIRRINAELDPDHRIKKYVLLPWEWDPGHGEITWNRKLRRSFLAERFQNLREAIAGDKDEAFWEPSGGRPDGKGELSKIPLKILSL